MDFAIEKEGRVLKVRVETTRLDGAAAYILETQVRPELREIDQIEIDCSQVRLIDSSGLVGLVTLAKLLSAKSKHKVKLLELTPTAEKLMKLSHLDTVFDIHASLDTQNLTD
jgi:anti-anti-sigma factor